MPITHVSLPTGPSSYEKMCGFYTRILAPLGYQKFLELEGKTYGMGPKNGNPDFWLHNSPTEFEAFDAEAEADAESRGGKTHVCFLVSSKREVQEWHATALYTNLYSMRVK
jgi:catechol 2,3-dioxygenase-like lactoylglutathione lyase family enzyme